MHGSLPRVRHACCLRMCCRNQSDTRWTWFLIAPDQPKKLWGIVGACFQRLCLAQCCSNKLRCQDLTKVVAHVHIVLVLDEALDGGHMAAVGCGVQRREQVAVLRVHPRLQLPHQQLYEALPPLQTTTACRSKDVLPVRFLQQIV